MKWGSIIPLRNIWCIVTEHIIQYFIKITGLKFIFSLKTNKVMVPKWLMIIYDDVSAMTEANYLSDDS